MVKSDNKDGINDIPKKIIKLNESDSEIKKLINTQDFIDFVQTISETLGDGITYNELLSSKMVLQKALRILQQLEKE